MSSIASKLLAFTAVLATAAGIASAAGARLTLLGGEIHRGVSIQEITQREIRYFRDGDKAPSKDEMADLVSLTFPGEVRTRLDAGPADVEIRLRGGDLLRGALLPAADEMVSISSPLLGPLSVRIDDVEEIRFIEAWAAAADRPAPPDEPQDYDLFHYTSLDRLVGTFLKVEANKLIVSTPSGDTRSIFFENLLSIRLADAPVPKPKPGRVAVLRLADGSRITAAGLTAKGEDFRATTVRGEQIRVHADDLLAIYQKGGRFVYLSDLTPAETKIVPWIGDVYAWDRPRFDQSILDRPLRAGGETYLKGIGVISGTSITFDLDGVFKTFTSLVALNDDSGAEGDVAFEVLLDGEVKYESGRLKTLEKGGKPTRIPPITLGTAKTLTLRVRYLDDFVRDFADWIEPMLIR